MKLTFFKKKQAKNSNRNPSTHELERAGPSQGVFTARAITNPDVLVEGITKKLFWMKIHLRKAINVFPPFTYSFMDAKHVKFHIVPYIYC